MSNSENLDIEIAKENITLSYKSGTVPVGAGSKEEFNRQINIKIEDKKDCQECQQDRRESMEEFLIKQNSIQNSLMVGFSIFMMCATFGMMAKHI